MPPNYNKNKERNKAVLDLWQWFRQQTEYKTSYNEWRKQTEKGSLLEYEIIKRERIGGGFSYDLQINPEDIGNSLDLDQKDEWIKKIFKLLKPYSSQARYLKQEAMKRKWGFYPLCDPDDDVPSGRFRQFVLDKLGAGLFSEAIELVNFPTLFSRRRKKLPLPPRLRIDVDYRQSAKFVGRQVAELIQKVKKCYSLHPVKPRSDSSELEVKVLFLKGMGFSKSRAKIRLTPKDIQEQLKESHLKRLQRALNKVY